MDHFLHRGGVLHAEDVAVPDVAAAVGTPFYLYSSATLVRHYRLFDEALAWAPERLVCFAVKACGNLAVLRTLAAEGAGMDVVSGGEIARALAAGVPGERIVFSGVGKTRAEMRQALEARVRQFNVESEPELEALSEVAASVGRRGARGAAGEPGRGRAHAREDRDRAARRQVRRAHRARAGDLRAGRPRCRGSRPWAWTSTSVPRSPSWRRSRRPTARSPS